MGILYGNIYVNINQIKKKLSMCESIIYNNLILYKNHKNNFFNIEIQMYVTFLAHNSWFVFIFYYFIFVYSQSTEANVQCDQFVHPKLVTIFYIVFFLISSSISFISSISYLYHILDRSLFIEFWISILYKVFTKNCLNSKKAKILFFCSIYFFIFLARHILLYLSYGKIFYSTIFYFLIW